MSHIHNLTTEHYYNYLIANGHVHSIILLYNTMAPLVNKYSHPDIGAKKGDALYEELNTFRENLITAISPITHQKIEDDHQLLKKVRKFLEAFEIKQQE